MTLRYKYQLQFKKKIEDWKIIFECYGIGNHISQIIARKINQMHILECEYLVEEIENAQTGKYFEEYFVLDHDEASDEDELKILPPNLVINISTKIPLEDMRLLLSEWLEFVKN